MVKLISKQSTDQYQRWDLPMVEDVSGAVANAKDDKAPGLMTAEQIERIQNQAYKEAYEAGFAKGREAGMASGKDEIARNTQLLDDLLQSLSNPFEILDDDITQQLVSLAVAIARQLVRRELKIDAAQIVGVVQEAIAVLPVGSRNVKVCLHPDDVRVMHDTLVTMEAERSWELVNDSGLSRGDCRILTETSRIDATLEKRLAAIASRILGGEREADKKLPPE
ncbi:MAG: flagellar assembly protein FliH [Gammaproteobacteria bacterium]|nr:flagellar assembly protein FliH [Gammaproteobacteria bacterium]